jgi:hypothetical protein
VLLRLKGQLGKQCYWAKNTGINVDSINSGMTAQLVLLDEKEKRIKMVLTVQLVLLVRKEIME